MENKYTRFGYAFVSVLMLATLAGCHRTGGEQGRMVLDSTPTSAVHYHTDSATVVSENYIIEEMRHPDVVLHIKRGQPLAMQTEGLILTAVDAAVQREADYSVTSLENEELPPMPQGMKNMTAAAAGYRLLPSGEHFMPYAELRVAYDPARLPQGYTPDDIYTSFYDTATLAWVRLERVEVDTVNHEIVSRTTHFTDFINELFKAPEMPETQALVPTAMTDLEAVSPMDGLTLIQPPTANNNGTANISYPLVIPSGRGGMQPNLTLTYSSTGGSGWLGVGWDIPVPSITLDTRWGVPRYSTTYETEIYMLDGEQLITRDSNGVPRKMPHRTNHQLPRLPDSTQFFARTGDAHDSIMRYGTGPQDYWWVVTDRNGITHYYGRYVDDARNVFPTTLCDDNGNIARWALAESRDLYGNNVRYYYSIDYVTGYGSTGRQLYIDSISYTGHLDTDGVYTVVFQRKDRDSSDIPMVCNNGFKEMTAQQLCHVALKYQNTIKTAWLFDMENSYYSNFKNRLSSFTKVDSTEFPFPDFLEKYCHDGNLNFETKGYASVTTRFSYYDAPSANSMFGLPHGSKLPDDTVSAFMVSGEVSPLGINKATALGISHSNSWNVGGALTVGVPSVELWNSNLSLGGNYHYNSSTSEGVMSLVDLDGDGLADKVFVKNGQMHFRRQLPPAGFTIRFSDTLYTIDSITSFLRENSSSNTWGVQASLAVGASASWTHSESETSTYFADVNGDGLVDLVEDDHVWFNRLENGYPTFARHEEITQVTGGDEPETPATDTLGNDCRGFIFDGEVNDSIDCRRIWVLIDFDEKPRDSSQIVNEISNYQGSNYKHVVVPSDTIGKWWLYIYRSEWDCDYHETTPNTEAVRVWIAPDSGAIEIVAKVSLLKDTSASRKDRRLADGVIYTIQQSTGIQYGDTLSNPNGSNTILLSQEICDTCYNPIDNDKTHYIDTTIISLKIARGDMLFFRLRSKNNHRLDNVHDSIEIVYTEGNMNGSVFHSHDDFVLSGKECFQAPVAGQLYIEGNYNGTNGFNLIIIVNDSSIPYTHDTPIDVEANAIVCFEVQADSSNSDPIWGDVSCRPHLTFYPNDSLMVTATVSGGNDTTYKNLDEMSLYLAAHMAINQEDSIYSLPICQQLFGPLYKGWGQFAYHSLDSGVHADTLRVEMLKAPDTVTLNTITQSTVDTNKFKNSSSLEEFQNNNNFFNPLSYSSYWVEMMPDAEHGVWISYGLQNTIGRDTMCNALHKEWYAATPELPDTADYTLPQAPSVSASTEDAPVKTTLKTTNASSQCYSLSALHLGLTYSNGMNGIGKDYIDLNGDRYPDFVGPEKVQYSQLWGGIGPLQDLSISLEGKNQSVTNFVGVNFSSSLAGMKRTVSNNTRDAEFTQESKGSSLGGGGSIGWDNTSGTWIDINGDGLPDFVTDNGYVKLNIGYRFLNQDTSGIGTFRSGVSGTLSESLSGEIPYDAFSLWQGSIKAGFGLDASNNRTTSMLIDLNGDGLPDRVFLVLNSLNQVFDSGVITTKVMFNQGNGNWSNPMDLNIDHLSSSTSFSENLDLGITVGIPLCCFNIDIGVNGSPYGGSVNRDHLQLVDINADGLPDLVTSDREDSITVRYNRGGRTNLLRTVTNFTGARFYLDYTLSAPSRQQPSRSWLLTAVTTKDPLNPNGGDTTVTHFDYADPHYDRFERTSYGYKYVTTTNIIPTNGNPYRKIKRTYYNNNMLRRGRLKEELTYVDSSTLYIKKVFDCEYRQWDSIDVEPDVDCPGYAFNMSERTTTTYYEGGTTPLLTTAEQFEYDRYHNVVRYTDLGDTNDPADGLVVTFHYLDNLPNNLIALRSDYKITDIGSSTPLRETRFEYDTTHGKLTRQVLLNGADSAVYDFEYDTTYGNLAVGIRPQNDSNQRMTYHYTYDNVVHTYPVHIENSHNEHMYTDYDYFFGKPTSITDPANNVMIYRYDFAGRLTSVTSPLNTSGTPSLVNCYHPINYYHDGLNLSGYPFNPSPTGHPYSISYHYDDNGTLVTKTAVLTDGFGRVLQTKKGLTVEGVEKMQVSGRTVTDAFGRTIEQYDPVLEDTSTHIGEYNYNYEPNSLTTTIYDVLDRIIKTVQPLGITTLTSYTIDGDESGHRYFITTTTDPNGYDTKQYSDYEGRPVQVTDANGGITVMHYDNLGQLEYSTDPEGFSTYYSYDMLGRMVQREHPDAGITAYTYDPAGNITQETTPLGQINYDYTYYRLMRKRYSNMTGNDVSYSYDNAGRPELIEDGSGMYECRYDALGNVIEETRTIALPNHGDVYQFRMKYTYDSWGRMLSMVYPDSEAISYTYQWGGDLYAMHGDKHGDPRTYIDNIHYNSYGQKSSVKYGNSTNVRYSYDELHRLVNLKSRDHNGDLMQDIDYTFDDVSNVTDIVNSAGVVNTLGGDYKNTYQYDSLYRLINSVGSGESGLGIYQVDMNYTPSGRIVNKFRDCQSVTLSERATMVYGYCNDYQPHAVRRMYDYAKELHYDLRWDEAGNLGQVSIANMDAVFERGRFLYWTEDNRLHTVADDRYYSYYTYDHSGERRLKLTGENDLLDVNADYMETFSILNNHTLYPSAYMVLTDRGYTKHYYAGTERVAARIGGGGLNALCSPIGQNRRVSLKAGLLFAQSSEQVNNRELQENDLECVSGNDFSQEEFMREINEIPYLLQAKAEIDNSDFYEMIRAMVDDSNDGREEEVYFYHSDHLGSASWITDIGGEAVQHLQYLPFGERYIDQRMSGYNERFTFTGKEKDEETGYGYFGARYMDHELMTMWLSVDPMSDKYPSISPYNYCMWNPVKLVDPDGQEVYIGGLGEKIQQRLVKCLSQITGLKLAVKDGFLISSGINSNITEYSPSARKDLLEAIGNTDVRVYADESDNDMELKGGDWGDIVTNSIYISSSFHAGNEAYDALTEGLGMAFLHELGHAYFGDKDPDIDESRNSFSYVLGHRGMPYPNCELDLGGAVTRVNGYRRELNMATRASYERYDYKSGDPSRWKQYEGKVAFIKDGILDYLQQR